MHFAKRTHALLATLLLATLTLAAAPNKPFDAQQIQFYENQIRPLLADNCHKCHGGEKIRGGLDLTSRDGLITGGETGPAIDLESPAKSLLLKAISHIDKDLQMPPKTKLEQMKVDLLTRWVEMGAPFSPNAEKAPAAKLAQKIQAPQVTPDAMKFWSFVPVKRPDVPQVGKKDWPTNAIDNFILARLEANQLHPAKPATRAVMIRRLTYDLTGLPPTPTEVETFLADNAPDAWEKLVDRLLSSAHYGERWARHWLDLVRFAETNSFERDNVKPNAWRYRDYIIAAFNDDKPYDQFIKEQLAGDELDTITAQSIVATGYYRLGQWDDEPTDKLQARYDELDDILATTGQTFLGLTLNCARCHDHKLDPIPQRDYYRMLAFFQNVTPYTKNPAVILTSIRNNDPKAYQDEIQSTENLKADIRKKIESYEQPAIKALVEAKTFPDDPKKRSEAIVNQIAKQTNEDEARRYEDLKKQLKELETRTDKTPQALCVRESGSKAESTFIMKRGNAHVPGEKVEPGFPAVLNPPDPQIKAPDPGAKSTNRRRALADYIASTQNPLAARVMVNRIWQQHFGRGIVRSPSDFGRIGDRPTHPELLDWLADEFVKQNWSIKKLHKLILMTSSYRMSSAGDSTALAKDPRNDLFWRFDMRRLEAEEIRDAILAVNGKLNPKMGGPGVFPVMPKEVLQGQSRPGDGWGQSSLDEQCRRSIYIHVKRSLPLPMLSTFDAADTDATCPARFSTTQSPQALTMLNSAFTNEQARAFATRVVKDNTDVKSQVRRALTLALSRQPGDGEIAKGEKFIESLKSEFKLNPDEALTQFCLLVLNLNEFVYLD